MHGHVLKETAYRVFKWCSIYGIKKSPNEISFIHVLHKHTFQGCCCDFTAFLKVFHVNVSLRISQTKFLWFFRFLRHSCLFNIQVFTLSHCLNINSIFVNLWNNSMLRMISYVFFFFSLCVGFERGLMSKKYGKILCKYFCSSTIKTLILIAKNK